MVRGVSGNASSVEPYEKPMTKDSASSRRMKDHGAEGCAQCRERRSATPVSTQLLHPPGAVPPWDAQAPMRPLPSSSPLEGDEDVVEVLEERYRALIVLMGEIGGIEGRLGAMRRRTR